MIIRDRKHRFDDYHDGIGYRPEPSIDSAWTSLMKIIAVAVTLSIIAAAFLLWLF